MITTKTKTKRTRGSRKQAIRDRCIDCCGCHADALLCKEKSCPLHEYLLGGSDKRGAVNTGRAKAVKDYCRWCCGGIYKEVQQCTCTDCPLYKYRLGGVEH